MTPRRLADALRASLHIPISKKRQMRIAVHEAGHVVAACVLWTPARVIRAYIDLIKDGGKTDLHASASENAPSDIALYFAGMAAERILIGGTPAYLDTDSTVVPSDFAAAVMHLNALGMDIGSEASTRMIRQGIDDAARIIRHNTAPLRAIAEYIRTRPARYGFRIADGDAFQTFLNDPVYRDAIGRRIIHLPHP